MNINDFKKYFYLKPYDWGSLLTLTLIVLTKNFIIYNFFTILIWVSIFLLMNALVKFFILDKQKPKKKITTCDICKKDLESRQ